MQRSGQKKRKSRLADETTEETLGSHQVSHDPSDLLSQDFGIRPPAVGQRALRVPPDPLVGIEFRGVSGQGNDVETTIIPPFPLDLFAAMDHDVVPEEEDVSAQVKQQVPKESGHVGASEIGLLGAEIKSYPSPVWTDSDGRGCRNLLPAEWAVAHRGHPAGRPRLAYRGDQEKPGFADEDEMGAQPRV